MPCSQSLEDLAVYLEYRARTDQRFLLSKGQGERLARIVRAAAELEATVKDLQEYVPHVNTRPLLRASTALEAFKKAQASK